ncbi:OsmC family protein [Stenotrophomonas tumulicola]|nr:OsmC family protein [Stenotrophomonas tumulicola]
MTEKMTGSAGHTLSRVTAHVEDVPYAVTMDVGGHVIVADEPKGQGGRNAGPSPFGLLLSALGACTAMTLRMYAEHKQWPLASLQVELRHLRPRGGGPNRIERVLVISGLDAQQRAKLADIAERTPVTLAIKGGVAIDTLLGKETSA